MDKKIKQLLNILTDSTARIDERDDAAIYLAKYPCEELLKALIKFASNPEENKIIIASVGESIGEIILSINKFDASFLVNLVPEARKEAVGIIKVKKPEWFNK
jgi:hypothetical protein